MKALLNFTASATPRKTGQANKPFLGTTAVALIDKRIAELKTIHEANYYGDGNLGLRLLDERHDLNEARPLVALPGLTGTFNALSTICAITCHQPRWLPRPAGESFHP